MRCLIGIGVVLLTVGCQDTRTDTPTPTAEILITADGGLRLDERPVTADKLDRELSRRAADAPNEKLGRTRLHVVIRRAPGIPYDRVLELQERCQALGISQVEVPR